MKNPKIIVLEDDEDRAKIFTAAYPDCFISGGVDEFVARAKEGFDYAFMDRDLGTAKTGDDAVRGMEGCSFRNARIIIHSMNIPAAESMENDLVRQGWQIVQRKPYIGLIGYLIAAKNFRDKTK